MYSPRNSRFMAIDGIWIKFAHGLLLLLLALGYTTTIAQRHLPNILVSTDIGGSDPDDYQSMVHLLMYADHFNIKGLISSPPHSGRKQHIVEVIQAYEKDYTKLVRHAENFPSPQDLLRVTKQGVTEIQANRIPDKPSEGAKWMIKKARESKRQPLYILVWGSMTDVAQAIHHRPGIKKNIRIYSIGSWNTLQDTNSRNYLYHQHRDLWWIENNTSFRGMYMGGYQEGNYGNESFVAAHVKDHGALGNLFWEKKKDIKMGDTPSVLYFLHGDINNPEAESWGGSFVKNLHGPNLWTDNPSDSLMQNTRAGAKTVNKFRKAYLDDWSKRMQWLKD